MVVEKVRLDDVTVIAELANAHEGDRSQAIAMVEAVSSSADAVKIQMFTADDLAVKSNENYELYQEISLSADDVKAIAAAAHQQETYLFADVLGTEGLGRVAQAHVDGFKIHSSDLTNHSLIRQISQHEKPTLVSAGGATTVEIKSALASFESVSDAELALVYGFQNYPTELEDANLNRLRRLIDEFGEKYVVGYTSHLDGGSSRVDEAKRLPAWSIAAGADFVEVHTTLDRSEQGLDYYSSLEPDAFEEMADNVETVQTTLGRDSLQMTESEIEYRHSHKKCVVATQEISAGEKINEGDVALKRPKGNPQSVFYDLNDAVGKTVVKEFEMEEPIRTSNVQFKVAATLACRAESDRLYGKPLQKIGEKSILSHQISQLRRVEAIDEIVLAISDTPSKSVFVEFAETRDLSYVVGDEDDVLGRIIRASNAVNTDLAVRTTTENPFIYQKAIGEQVEQSIAKNADLVVTRNLPLGAFAEVVSVSALERAHDLGEDRHRSELVTSFITENPGSFKIVGIEPPETLNRPDVRLTVDNPCDLILVRRIWKHVSNQKDPYNLESILESYDVNSLKEINSGKPDGDDKEVTKLSWHVYGDEVSEMKIITQEDQILAGKDGR